MNIIYVTSAMETNDFVAYETEWSIPLNPSNQNFHNKIIRALAKHNKVNVISIRPFSRRYCSRYSLERSLTKEENIVWDYLAIIRRRFFREYSLKIQIDDLLTDRKLDNTIVFVDTLSPTLLKIANYLKKNYNLKVIGICTDSPSNISGTTKIYTNKILDYSRNFDGFLALTNELGDLFNKKSKPQLIFEGIVEDKLPNPIVNEFGDYFFFGGALMEKYGVFNLIKAFNEIEDHKMRLLICGHHANEEQLNKAIEDNPRIIYLGILPNKKVLQLEMNAIGNINPRPFSEDLDRFSVPSKTIEYISTGIPTISVKNSKLKKNFNDNIIWAKTAEPRDLYNAMTKLLNLTEDERKNFGLEAQAKVKSLYSLEAISEKLDNFLLEFTK